MLSKRWLDVATDVVLDVQVAKTECNHHKSPNASELPSG